MEKKKISNSEELNKYYNMINLKLKKFSEMNIPHNKVANYLKPGSDNFNTFISEDDELKNVDGIDVVLRDIIQDTLHAHRDGLFKKTNTEVKKFENLIVENILDTSRLTKKDEYEHEKALADIYKVGMSSIDLLRPDLHLYSINDFGKIDKIMIWNKDEVLAIKENIVKQLCEEVKKRTTKLLFDKVITIEELIVNADIFPIISEKISMEDALKHISSNTGLETEVEFLGKRILNSSDYYLFKVS